MLSAVVLSALALSGAAMYSHAREEPATQPSGPRERGPREGEARGPREGGPGAPGGREGGREGRGQSLERAMEGMERNLKVVKDNINQPGKDPTTLDALARFQGNAAIAKTMLPPHISKLPEAERPAAAIGYRKMMIEVLKTAIEIEEAVMAGDRDKAKGGLATLEQLETVGHGEHRPKH
jgi:hypothetical protein